MMPGAIEERAHAWVKANPQASDPKDWVGILDGV
jgi:hypothetical protein